MDFREYDYLIALAEEKSISKAAERLYMAQSSLSQFLTQYEHDLRTKLFLRTSKGIRLTANGEVYIDHLRHIRKMYLDAKNELWDNEHMQGGQVTLGISSFRGKRTLPLILKRFKELYPAVKVNVYEANSIKLEDALLKGEIDVGIIALPPAKLKHDVATLCKDEIYIIAPKDHPIIEECFVREDGKGLWIKPEIICKYDLILSYYDTILGNGSRNLFRRLNLKYNAIFDNITAEMAVSMASAGLGLAFTYTSSVKPSPDYELLRINKEGIFLDLGTAFPSHEYHSKASSHMEMVIREVYDIIYKDL